MFQVIQSSDGFMLFHTDHLHWLLSRKIFLIFHNSRSVLTWSTFRLSKVPSGGSLLVYTKHMEIMGFARGKREGADVAFCVRPLIEFIQSSNGTIPGSGTDG